MSNSGLKKDCYIAWQNVSYFSIFSERWLDQNPTAGQNLLLDNDCSENISKRGTDT